jgi:hypothetical protein
MASGAPLTRRDFKPPAFRSTRGRRGQHVNAGHAPFASAQHRKRRELLRNGLLFRCSGATTSDRSKPSRCSSRARSLRRCVRFASSPETSRSPRERPFRIWLSPRSPSRHWCSPALSRGPHRRACPILGSTRRTACPKSSYIVDRECRSLLRCHVEHAGSKIRNGSLDVGRRYLWCVGFPDERRVMMHSLP